MHGVLVIDKPVGPTSHDVVARVRRVLGERRVGHTGTLDPFATGVLPLVVGQATRLARFYSGSDKSYVAEVRLGLSTDTHDLTGHPVGGVRLADAGAPLPTAQAVDAALEAFRGRFLQRPPAFSAKKLGGVRSYDLARARRRRRDEPDEGRDQADAPAVAPAPVEVVVRALALEHAEDDRVRLRMTVSAGFYVRALAHELGERLGCGAHLVALRRTATGEFGEADAVPLESLEREGAASARLVPLDRLLPGCPAVTLTAEGLARVCHGNTVEAAHCAHDGRGAAGPGPWPAVRLLAPDGRLVAINLPPAPGKSGGDHPWPLHPAIVLT